MSRCFLPHPPQANSCVCQPENVCFVHFSPTVLNLQDILRDLQSSSPLADYNPDPIVPTEENSTNPTSYNIGTIGASGFDYNFGLLGAGYTYTNSCHKKTVVGFYDVETLLRDINTQYYNAETETIISEDRAPFKICQNVAISFGSCVKVVFVFYSFYDQCNTPRAGERVYLKLHVYEADVSHFNCSTHKITLKNVQTIHTPYYAVYEPDSSDPQNALENVLINRYSIEEFLI